MSFELPPLPYNYNELEPYIDVKTMEIHHGKHHQGYVDKLNQALESHSDLQEKSVEELLANLDVVPEEIRLAVRNSGGGHFNHSLFWPLMKKDGGGEPDGKVAEEIEKKFGGFSVFKEQFSTAVVSVFGSGWAWLVIGEEGELEITITPNQDSPISVGQRPILGLDVWEHAYYLKHQNRRAEYIEAWWNVVNWEQVESNFSS